MKKIKLVVSDFHIGTGVRQEDGRPNILEDFHHEAKFIEFLEFYSTNKYSKFSVELIFNGDTFNLLQVDYKEKTHSIITESLSIYQMKQVLNGWPKFFDALQQFNNNENNSITFITGNHDPQLLWDGVKEVLRKRIGGTINFHNISYTFDGIHVEHGQQAEAQNKFDPAKFFLFKRTPEPILNLPWATRFCIECLTDIKKKNPTADKIKPFSKYLRWALIYDTKFFFIGILQTIIYTLKTLFIPQRYSRLPFFKTLRVILTTSLFPKLDHYAKDILKSNKIHTVIFGHTHNYKYFQYGLDKEYINTGTWTNMISLNLNEFGTKTFLSYAIIKYPKNSRPRAKLKRWHGYWNVMEDVF